MAIDARIVSHHVVLVPNLPLAPGITTAFLKMVGVETLVALSPDYETRSRLKEPITQTKSKVDELHSAEPDLRVALKSFYDDEAVRILTIHKSKGLEFDSVIMLAIEEETFFGSVDAERCAFFVGVSRAKRRLVLTHADQRPRPANYAKRWNVFRRPQQEYIKYALPFVDI